ncbi:type III pantothenate kinase [Crenothrix sp.]|uniref:type III pantothenate kinase n=1 Tax=Crenothrix sp. TaxID=3100433 RepID=UPI00374D1138
MRLLVDIGNTRLKWGLADQGEIMATGVLVNSHISSQVLIDTWQALVSPQLIALSCVNSPQIIELISSAATFLWPHSPVIKAQSLASQCGVRNAYEQPEKLGVDRWLALIAAHHSYHQTLCIVDCGTAITVDVMTGDGNHQGGLICPGLTLMRHSLAHGTHQLPLSEQNYTVGLANSTESAIFSGILSAACGLIERVIAQQPKPIQLILTGGDAGIISTQLACEAIIDDNLVLRGLIYVSEEYAVKIPSLASTVIL